MAEVRGLKLVWGRDHFRAWEQAREWWRQAGKPLEVLRGRVEKKELREALGQRSLWGGGNTLLLREVWGHLSAETRERLVRRLVSEARYRLCVIWEGEAFRDAAWKRLLKAADEQVECKMLKEAALLAWLQQQARKHGWQLTQQTAALILARTGLSSWRAAQALQIVGMVAGPRITAKAVKRLVPLQTEERVFQLLNYAEYGKATEALRAAKQQLRQGEAPERLWALLLHQVWFLLAAADALARGDYEGRWAEELSLHPYRARRIAAWARHYPVTYWKKTLELFWRWQHELREGILSSEDALLTALLLLSNPQAYQKFRAAPPLVLTSYPHA
jgi:DNA polymerase III delta subunit